METTPPREPRLFPALLVALCLAASPAVALPSLVGDGGQATPAAADPPTVAPVAAEELLQTDPAALDARIETVLSRRLALVAGLEDVEVTATAGVVTLRGEVTDEQDRALASKLALGVAEVVEVRNRLAVSTHLGRRLEPAMEAGRERVSRLVSALPLLAVAVVVVWLFAWFGGWLSRRQRLFRRARRNPFLASLLRQAVRTAVLLVGLLIALDLLGATALVGAVLGTAGVIGLVLGFAFRDLVENYVASILLSLRQPFAPNDHVVIDGHEGRVVTLNSRATTLMTLEGNHLRLPNAMVFKSVLLNYTRNPRRQFHFTVGVGTGEDLARAQSVGVGVLRTMKGVLDDPEPFAAVMELADSSVTVQFFAWIDQRETSWLKARSEAMRLVKAALAQAGIDMPEPIYRVQLQQPGASVAASAPAPPPLAPAAEQSDVSAADDLEQQIASERAQPSQRARDLLDPDAERE